HIVWSAYVLMMTTMRSCRDPTWRRGWSRCCMRPWSPAARRPRTKECGERDLRRTRRHAQAADGQEAAVAASTRAAPDPGGRGRAGGAVLDLRPGVDREAVVLLVGVRRGLHQGVGGAHPVVHRARGGVRRAD